jgi:hypothetical protein
MCRSWLFLAVYPIIWYIRPHRIAWTGISGAYLTGAAGCYSRAGTEIFVQESHLRNTTAITAVAVKSGKCPGKLG